MKHAKMLGYAQDILVQSSAKNETLGMPAWDCYGNMYRYAQAGSSALAVGKLTAAADIVANHINIDVAVAAAIGAKRVQVTLGATLATENQYQDGLLVVNAGTGLGYQYRIKNHLAADSAGSLWVELIDDNPIRVALVAGTSKVSLHANKFKGVTISSNVACVVTGAPMIAVTASYYYWSLVKGESVSLGSGTETVGTMLIPHSTDGATGTIASSVAAAAMLTAVQRGTAASGEYRLAELL